MRRGSLPLPTMPRIVVYGLALSENGASMRFFFVGGLVRNPNFGVAQHVAWLRETHPALSQHLKLLDGNVACTVRAIILRECDAHAEYDGLPYKAQLDNNVRFETIHLMRAGHTLLNARCGTPIEREALVADAVGTSIRCAGDLENRHQLMRKRASHLATRHIALDLFRKEWLRGRTHERDRRALYFLFSRAFPATWRRLVSVPGFSMPSCSVDCPQALSMMFEQARAAHPRASNASVAGASRPVKRSPAMLNPVDPIPASLTAQPRADKHAARRGRKRRDRLPDDLMNMPSHFTLAAS